MTLCVLLLTNTFSFSQSPLIHQMVQQVSGDTLFATIADLQPMDRVNASNSMVPAYYLKQRLQQYDVDTVFFHFFKDNTPPNVIGIRYGELYPDDYYILGGHYDAVLPGAGADDNASGTAGVLEMARVTRGIKLQKSLMLILFAAEEVGLWGSFAFVDSAINHSVNIEGMINMDMIAYSHNLTDSSVSVCYKYHCLDMLDTFMVAAGLYVPELGIETDSSSAVIWASDHAPFWLQQIPALFLIENSDRWGGSFNPYYHTFADTIGMGANSPWLAEKITRSAVATLLLYVEPFLPIGIELPTYQKPTVTLYPNPTHQQFTIRSPQLTQHINLTLFDNTGRVVLSQMNLPNGHSVDISSLPHGVYFVRIDIDGEAVTKKVVKM